MKVCSKCEGEPQPLENFNNLARSKDGKHPWCRECQREEGRERYKIDPNRRATVRKTDKKIRKSKREFLDTYKLERGCADCGYNAHPAALDLDHVRGEKIGNVSTMVGGAMSKKKIQEELDKCEVVCSNCHRVRTYNRRIEK